MMPPPVCLSQRYQPKFTERSLEVSDFAGGEPTMTISRFALLDIMMLGISLAKSDFEEARLKTLFRQN